ncbi:hypothetical protein PENTCL1PPCAC_29742, partial [Pristionchus entomophagus]
ELQKIEVMELPSSWMEMVGTVVTGSCLLWSICFLIRRAILERFYDKMEGRVIVITGCDSGFGRDTALQLVSKGCIVLAGCFLESSLSGLKDETGHNAHRLETIKLNLEDDASIDSFVKAVKTYLKINNERLWGFVNNAGLFAAGPSEWMTRDVMKRIFQVNTIGAMELSNRMAPLLHRTGGRMVSISSVSALVHGPQLSLYGASKAALDNFQSAMRVESQRQFSVHLVLPGGFRTPLLNPDLLRQNIAGHWSRAPKEVQHEYGTDYYNAFVTNWSEGVVRYANPNPSWVVQNVEHALFASHPRDRYYTGYDAIALFSILSFAPTWLQDRVLRRANERFFKIRGRRVTMALYDDSFEPLEEKPDAA